MATDFQEEGTAEHRCGVQGRPRREVAAAAHCSKAMGLEGKGDGEEHHLPVVGTGIGKQGAGTVDMVGCTAAAMVEVVQVRLAATVAASCQYLAGGRKEVTGRGSAAAGTKTLLGRLGAALGVVEMMVLGWEHQGLRAQGQGRPVMASWADWAEAAGR